MSEATPPDWGAGTMIRQNGERNTTEKRSIQCRDYPRRQKLSGHFSCIRRQAAEHTTRSAVAAPTSASRASVHCCWSVRSMRANGGSVCSEKSADGRQKQGKRRSTTPTPSTRTFTILCAPTTRWTTGEAAPDGTMCGRMPLSRW